MKYLRLFESFDAPDHRDYGEIIASTPEFAGYLEKILQHYRARTATPLGYGGWGAAYLLNTNMVLKITHDDVEAYCAHVLLSRKNRSRCFAQIHSVEGVEFPATHGKDHYWVVVQEKVERQTWFIRLVKKWWNDMSAPYRDVLTNATYDRDALRTHCFAQRIDEEDMEWLVQGLCQISKAIEQAGLTTSTEIHPGNLGYRSVYGERELVLFDLGGGGDDYEYQDPHKLVGTIKL